MANFNLRSEDILAGDNPAWKAAVLGAPAGEPTALPKVVAARPKQNKTELRYAARLDRDIAAGRVLSYRFEPITIKLDEPATGRAIRYTPDYRVVHADGAVSLDEVKGGFIREDAMLKFRWACEQWDDTWFRMWQWTGEMWVLLRESKPRAATRPVGAMRGVGWGC
jgi:hypothetical protein